MTAEPCHILRRRIQSPHLALVRRGLCKRNDDPEHKINNEARTPEKQGKKKYDPDNRDVDVQESSQSGADTADCLIVRIAEKTLLAVALLSGI